MSPYSCFSEHQCFQCFRFEHRKTPCIKWRCVNMVSSKHTYAQPSSHAPCMFSAKMCVLTPVFLPSVPNSSTSVHMHTRTHPTPTPTAWAHTHRTALALQYSLLNEVWYFCEEQVGRATGVSRGSAKGNNKTLESRKITTRMIS